MRKLSLALWLLFVGTFALAQNASVTATVVDSDGQAWNNGTYTITFMPPSGYTAGVYTFNGSGWIPPSPVSGALTALGVLNVPTLQRNDFILPSSSHWMFTLCPQASAPCSSTTLTINQASQNISGSLVLVAPRFAATTLGTGAYGYADVEVFPANPPIGLFYWNVTLSALRFWNGSTWTSQQGSGVSISLTGDVSGSGTSPVTTTLATVNSSPGSCGDSTHVCQVTTDAKGRTTNQAAIVIANGSAITALTGDVSAAGPGSAASTLATVNSNVGTCGDATHVPQVTLDAKGRTTACTPVVISGGGGGALNGPVNAQTGTSYTLLLTDGPNGLGTVTMNNAAINTVTVPTNASVAFPVGAVIAFTQLGAGQTTIAAAGGVTINTPTSLSARAQYSTIAIKQLATNVWIAYGDLQ